MKDDSAEIPFQSFSAGAPFEQLWHGQGCPFFDVVHPAFPLPTAASPIQQGALNDGRGEAVVEGEIPEPCRFPPLDSCQKRFLWNHKEVDLAPHPVVGLVLQVGVTEKFPQALDSKAWILFFRVSKQCPCFTAVEEDGGGGYFTP